jgi:hypothetical protein
VVVTVAWTAVVRRAGWGRRGEQRRERDANGNHSSARTDHVIAPSPEFTNRVQTLWLRSLL